MDILEFITTLLDENDFVVVSGIGGFVATYQPARVDLSGKVIHPPSRTVSFVAGMKGDDGLLVHQLAQRLRITVSDAQEMLLQFTGDLRYRLEKGDTIPIPGLGILFLKEGIPWFTSSEEAEVLPDAFGLRPVSIDGLSAGGIRGGTALPAPPPLTGQALTERNRSRKYLVLWLGLALLTCLVFLLLRHCSRKEPPQESPSAANTRLQTQSALPSAADTTAAATQAPAPAVPVPAVPVPDTIPQHPSETCLYLVGGSFLSEENAGKYIAQMERKGCHPISLGRVGSYYLVALDTFTLRRDALQALRKMKAANPGKDFWIYHPPTPK